MNVTIKQLMAFTAAVIAATGTVTAASPEQLYQSELANLKKQASMFFDNPLCRDYINRNWSRFSGDRSEYQQLEQEYMSGALKATQCGLQRGYVMYVWLSHLEDVQSNQKFAGKGLPAQLREATNRVLRTKVTHFDDFMHQVDCHAGTPRISAGSSFTQTVHVSCSTPFGPAAVNLDSLHITVGGKDAWNGQRDEFFGKSFRSIYR